MNKRVISVWRAPGLIDLRRPLASRTDAVGDLLFYPLTTA